MQKYIKPRFILINLSNETGILAGSNEQTDLGGGTEGYDAKAQTFRIFDDTDDWSDEDY